MEMNTTKTVILSNRTKKILEAEAKRQHRSKSDIIRSLLEGCETPKHAKKNRVEESRPAKNVSTSMGDFYFKGCETPKRITRTITITETVEVL